jgi:hypothetical protein
MSIQNFCVESMPTPTVENVCEVLARAHLHDAEKVKLNAAEYIKQNAEAVVETEGWQALQHTHPELVKFLIVQLSRT